MKIAFLKENSPWRTNLKLKIFKSNNLLILIIFLGTFLRVYNINWDSSYSLHPDERAIIMTTLKLKPPENLSEVFTKESPLNPQFFAYGSLPFYLLMIVSAVAGLLDPNLTTYGGINLVGRFISSLADILTIIILFLIGKKLFNSTIALLSAFFYAIAVFPIQTSHFYAVDVLLTFFITLTLYQLLRFYKNPNPKNALLVGLCFGASLATKVSALPLIIAIAAALVIDFLLIILKTPHKPHIWFPHIPKFLKRLTFDGLIICLTTLTTFLIFEPYALIDFQTFWQQSLQQSQMTHDAFIFPYTLQYVGKIPYLYELKNIYLWGLGPITAALSFIGLVYFAYLALKKTRIDTTYQEIILLVFFICYFAIVGKFAVGWMRYMLPLYPLLCLFAAVFLANIIIPYLKSLKQAFPAICYLLFAILLLVWPFAFMRIYTQPNTRITATEWIHKNIKPASRIAVEHWDDRLPIYQSDKFLITDLPLYDADTERKWRMIDNILKNTDYIILASNRLYTPLQKLTDCQNLPPDKCYPLTAEYYKKLFNGNLGFIKVAEFTSYPAIGVFEIRDDSADESFTVYDHPKVMVFKKLTR